jgi:hypothetical protein
MTISVEEDRISKTGNGELLVAFGGGARSSEQAAHTDI